MTTKTTPTIAELEAARVAFLRLMDFEKIAWETDDPDDPKVKQAAWWRYNNAATEFTRQHGKTFLQSTGLAIRALKAKAAGAKMLPSDDGELVEALEMAHDVSVSRYPFEDAYKAMHKAAPCMLEDSNGP